MPAQAHPPYDPKALRRCVLTALYDLFRRHPFAPMDPAFLGEACGVDPATLNWNLVYLAKCGLVELATGVDNPPFVACAVELTAAGVDVVEDPAALQRRFPDPPQTGAAGV